MCYAGSNQKVKGAIDPIFSTNGNFSIFVLKKFDWSNFYFKMKPKILVALLAPVLGGRLTCHAVVFCRPGALLGYPGLSQVPFLFSNYFLVCV